VRARARHVCSRVTHKGHLLVAILVDNVVDVRGVVDAIMIVYDTLDAHVVFWPVHPQRLPEPATPHAPHLVSSAESAPEPDVRQTPLSA